MTRMSSPHPQRNGYHPVLPPRLREWSGTHILIAINIACYALDSLSGDQLQKCGGLEIDKLRDLQIWRLLSFQFLHWDVWHIAMNMLALYFFGPVVENLLGKARFLAFYLVCGIGGGVCFALFWKWHLLNVSDQTALIGASASVLGVTMAAARLNPHMQLMLLFPPLPLKIKTLVLIYFAVAITTLISRHGYNQGGEAAHLGGLIVGAALIGNKKWLLPRPSGQTRRKFWKPGDPSTPFFRDVD